MADPSRTTRLPGASPRPVARLDCAAVLAWRMRRQHLERRTPRGAMGDVVAAVAGLHAQVMSSAELSLWARVEALEPDAVREALWDRRALVKTWAMRGTLHLLPADELALWVGAQGTLKPRHHGAAWLRHHGLTRDEAEAMLAAIPRTLAGPPLTREELAAAVAVEVGSDELGERLRDGFGALLKPAAFRGDLCFAPSSGQHVRFTRPDRWLGAWAPMEPEEAMREVARGYLAAYGPATRERFARWFGMTSPAQAGRALASVGEDAVTVDVDGESAWMLAEHVAEAQDARPSGTVRLLPAFDPYVVAAPREGDAVLAPAFRGRVYRPQGWLSPVLVRDGRVLGVWRHERRGGRVAIAVEPFDEVGRDVRHGAEAEAERLAGFLGEELELRWG